MNTDNSRMVLVVSGHMAGKSYVQELINKISDNVDVVVADKIGMWEEEKDYILYNKIPEVENFHLELRQSRETYAPSTKDTSFRGGSRGKGGKTKYKRN
jgi:hypothetical protein